MRTQLAQAFSKQTALIQLYVTKLDPNVTYVQKDIFSSCHKTDDVTFLQKKTTICRDLEDFASGHLELVF